MKETYNYVSQEQENVVAEIGRLEPPVSGSKYGKGDDFTSPFHALLRGQPPVGTDSERLVEKVFRYYLKEKPID